MHDNIVDPFLRENHDKGQWKRMMRLALKCVAKNRRKRPTMRQVREKLESVASKEEKESESDSEDDDQDEDEDEDEDGGVEDDQGQQLGGDEGDEQMGLNQDNQGQLPPPQPPQVGEAQGQQPQGGEDWCCCNYCEGAAGNCCAGCWDCWGSGGGDAGGYHYTGPPL